MQRRFHLVREEQGNDQQETEDRKLYTGAQPNAVPEGFRLGQQGQTCWNGLGADGVLPGLGISRTAAVSLKTDAHRRFPCWLCNHACHPLPASSDSPPAPLNFLS